mmetsp:Transcript_1153/g.3966  ORF Transcript_1153/g.3966 Transcript_1153/m.3966 type:complete len:309 (+) Transcript_1153:2863-3789(+)
MIGGEKRERRHKTQPHMHSSLLFLLIAFFSSAVYADSNKSTLKDHAKVADASIKAASFDASARYAASHTLNSLSSYSGGYGAAGYPAGAYSYGGYGAAGLSYPGAYSAQVVGPSAYTGYQGGYGLGPVQYGSGYGLPVNSYYGYGPYGPVDSVQAQGLRSLATASSNAGTLLTIKNNNNALLNLPAQLMGIDNAVDATTHALLYGGSPLGNAYGNMYASGYGSGYLPSSFSSYAAPGSTGAAIGAAATINNGLYDYVAGNSQIGTSAGLWDTVQNTHAQFSQALSNAAAQQRVSHEAAYAASSFPPYF